MKKTLLAATAAAGLMAFAGIANAADASAGSVDWSGIYLGVSGGAHSYTSTVENGNAEDYEYVYPGDSVDATAQGFIGGIGAGYNVDMNGIVLGVEGDFSALSGEANSPVYDAYVVNDSSLNWLGTLRSRVGMAFDNLLVYGTAGLAYGQTETKVCDDECGYYGYDKTEWKAGWVAGLGAEYALTEAVSVKAEGLYYDLGSRNEHDTVSDYTDYKESNTGLIARMGVNFKF